MMSDDSRKAAKPHVLMLGPSPDSQGGIASVAKTLITSELAQGCRMEYIATTVDGSKPRKLLQGIQALFRFSRRINSADLVHIHFSYGVSMKRKAIFARLARKAGKRVILHCHSSEVESVLKNGSKKQLEGLRDFLRLGDVTITMSQYWKRLFCESLFIPEESIAVIPNGISLNVLPRRDYSNRELKILYLGRIEPEKGIDILLEGVAALSRSHEYGPISIILAGVGSDEAMRKYEDMAQKLNLNCTFWGWADESAKRSLFQACDVFVLPSLREVFPMALLEAMGAGIPCIASDCGSIPDIIEDGVSGVVFETGNIDSFISKSAPLLMDDRIREAYSQKGREKVENEYGIESVSRKMANLYEGVING